MLHVVKKSKKNQGNSVDKANEGWAQLFPVYLKFKIKISLEYLITWTVSRSLKNLNWHPIILKKIHKKAPSIIYTLRKRCLVYHLGRRVKRYGPRILIFFLIPTNHIVFFSKFQELFQPGHNDRNVNICSHKIFKICQLVNKPNQQNNFK